MNIYIVSQDKRAVFNRNYFSDIAAVDRSDQGNMLWDTEKDQFEYAEESRKEKRIVGSYQVGRVILGTYKNGKMAENAMELFTQAICDENIVLFRFPTEEELLAFLPEQEGEKEC